MNAGGAAFVEQTLRSNNCAAKTPKIDARHPVQGAPERAGDRAHGLSVTGALDPATATGFTILLKAGRNWPASEINCTGESSLSAIGLLTFIDARDTQLSAHCGHHHPIDNRQPPGYRRVLWIALAVNAVMFLIEVGVGMAAGSMSLLADSLDFLGDAANYGISLWVLRLAMRVRARASMIKAWSMAIFGVWVLGSTAWHALAGGLPDASAMGIVGSLALIANVAVAMLLYSYRFGDSNMRSVWLCTRNDAIGNLAVLVAALGVVGTGSAWPDLMVAAIMGGLALSSAWQVIRQARSELAEQVTPANDPAR